MFSVYTASWKTKFHTEENNFLVLVGTLTCKPGSLSVSVVVKYILLQTLQNVPTCSAYISDEYK